MKGKIVILDHLGDRQAAALMVDDQLEDLFFDPPEEAPPGVGALYRAILDRPMKGQGAVLARLPNGTGFLRNAKAARPGVPRLVQVSGVAEPGKAVPLTDRILFKSRYAIVTPDAPGLNIARSIRDEDTRGTLRALAEDAMSDTDPSLGLILRSAAADATEDEVFEDITAMRNLAVAVQKDADGSRAELLLDPPSAHELAWREWSMPDIAEIVTEPGGFEAHGIHDALDELIHPLVALGASASLAVEPTRALVAVDINTGADTSPAAGLKANIAAAKALPRQLRLRGFGGQIVVDWAPMPKKDRKALEQTLRAAFRADATETSLVGWTPLGHYELQRKRDRLPLSEVLPT